MRVVSLAHRGARDGRGRTAPPAHLMSMSLTKKTVEAQTLPAPANLRDWKHSLQKTGRPCVGLNGTVVSLPQAEHVVRVSTRSRTALAPTGRAARLPLQALHRFGSFLKFLSAKNCCSPAVQMNSVPQSTHLRILSWNSIGRYLVGVGRVRATRPPGDADASHVRASGAPGRLFELPPELLTIAFPCKRLLGAALVARLQIEGVLLDVFNNVLLLHLPLEPAESALD